MNADDAQFSLTQQNALANMVPYDGEGEGDAVEVPLCGIVCLSMVCIAVSTVDATKERLMAGEVQLLVIA